MTTPDETMAPAHKIQEAISTLLTTDGKGKKEKNQALHLLLTLAYRQNNDLKNIWWCEQLQERST